MIRAAILTPGIHVGGTERWIADLITWVKDPVRWWDIAAVHPAPRALAGQVRGLAKIRIGPDAVRSAFRENDVVVAWGIGGIVRPADAQARLVIVAHGDGRSVFTKNVISSNTSAEGMVGVSQEAMACIPARHDGVAMLENGVDPGRLVARGRPERNRSSMRIPPQAKVLTYVGRLSAEKNPWMLAELSKTLPEPWHVVVAGAGAEQGKIKARGGPRLRMLGVRHDIGDILAASDALLVPSFEEGFGFVIAEGWAARTPVISTLVGCAVGHDDLVRALPNPASAADARAAILADDEDQEGRAYRVARAYDHACSTLNMEAFGQRWANYLDHVTSIP